jgi:hypothetical protein
MNNIECNLTKNLIYFTEKFYSFQNIKNNYYNLKNFLFKL